MTKGSEDRGLIGSGRRGAGVLLTLLGVTVALVAPRPAAAHEEAVLEASAAVVAAGGSLVLTGSDFAAGEEYRLRLEGALEGHDLVAVTPDSTGSFRMDLQLPAEVRQGRYQVVAYAPDGDEVARMDLNVLPRASGSTGTADGDAAGDGGAEDGASGGGGGEREARADEMEIERSRGTVEWAVVLLVVGLSGGLGGWLLRGAA